MLRFAWWLIWHINRDSPDREYNIHHDLLIDRIPVSDGLYVDTTRQPKELAKHSPGGVSRNPPDIWLCVDTEDEFDRMIIHPGEILSLIEALNETMEYIEAWKRGMGMA